MPQKPRLCEHLQGSSKPSLGSVALSQALHCRNDDTASTPGECLTQSECAPSAPGFPAAGSVVWEASRPTLGTWKAKLQPSACPPPNFLFSKAVTPPLHYLQMGCRGVWLSKYRSFLEGSRQSWRAGACPTFYWYKNSGRSPLTKPKERPAVARRSCRL